MKHVFVRRFSIPILVAAIVCGIAAWGQTPISSDGSLGPLVVPAGSVVFDTGNGTYSINGAPQPGIARLVTLPTDSGGIEHGPTDIYVFDFTDIDLSPGVNVAVVGEFGLVLLASGTANVGAQFILSGAPGESGDLDVGRGGGGGSGGGSLSVFADGDVAFSGSISANGGNGGSSFVAGGGGGAGGVAYAGGGAGGQGGVAEAGGAGAVGGNGGLVGFTVLGTSVGFLLPGGGGGGGGGYSGGGGGGGSSGGLPGVAGAAGLCFAAGPGGIGGAGASTAIFGTGGAGGAGGSTAGNPGVAGGIGAGGTGGAGGGGGGGGSAPGGGAGGAGGAGSLFAGGGGGGGGGDLCVPPGTATPKPQNGGGGSGGGGTGTPGSVVPTSPTKSGGGGGGGKTSLGSNTGRVTMSGEIEAVGGAAPSGDGGQGSLLLIAPSATDVDILPGAVWNGVAPLSPGSNSSFQTGLNLSDFLPAGGAGGGGGGGAGLVLEAEPGVIPTMSEWGIVLMALLLMIMATIVFAYRHGGTIPAQADNRRRLR